MKGRVCGIERQTQERGFADEHGGEIVHYQAGSNGMEENQGAIWAGV